MKKIALNEYLRKDVQNYFINSWDKHKIIRKIKVNPGLSATKLISQLYEETIKKIHPDTVRRALKESDYNDRVVLKNRS